MEPRRRATTARALERAAGELAREAVARMEATLPWFQALPAESRSWVGLIAQAGIAAFVNWFKHPDRSREITAEIFGTAPRDLARTVSLRQTVEMVRITVDVVEDAVERIVEPPDVGPLREAILIYSREVAFAAAQVYAQAAESRGAWDARLEAIIVDALVRGEAGDVLRSRAAALGWRNPTSVAVVVGMTPDDEPEVVVDGVRRAARHAGWDVLAGVQGDRLIAVLGGVADPMHASRALLAQFGPGPVVIGPTATDLVSAGPALREALAGLRAARARPSLPRPVHARDLLPERALDGDELARTALVESIYQPLVAAGLVDTVATYLEQAGSLEATARMLFIHTNTVRYRLRRVADLTGYSPTDPRDAFALHLALVYGRLTEEKP
ncbi:transcriptional regulator, CdaR family [Acidothermus cellulolyticus 11B]|uniref:Transcriptional regulator, CdaR family n=1 Tax=Acidothermus cellulolyticus (strain ATCC 43068 / DSM 8971 / 11B) TaxID=351607 RepID=A0LT92_ACIC1|nr:transcriptional regulator, CdaR family [Acidothermus cellulolyticus 11B]